MDEDFRVACRRRGDRYSESGESDGCRRDGDKRERDEFLLHCDLPCFVSGTTVGSYLLYPFMTKEEIL